MNQEEKTRLLTYQTLKFIKIDILPVFFPLSVIEKLAKMNWRYFLRCRDLS